jgi:hypothetical protein
MSKRKNTFTRFIEDIVDDTRDLVDDVLDRAKGLETDVRVAVQDVTADDDDSQTVSTSGSGVADLQVALGELTAKVNRLAELQVASAATASKTAAAPATTTSGATSSGRRSAAA